MVGALVDASDQLNCFLCGLGPSFETFSTSVRTSRHVPVFRDLFAQAESHKMFLRSLHGPSTPPVAFVSASAPKLNLRAALLIHLVVVIPVVVGAEVGALHTINCVVQMDILPPHAKISHSLLLRLSHLMLIFPKLFILNVMLLRLT